MKLSRCCLLFIFFLSCLAQGAPSEESGQKLVKPVASPSPSGGGTAKEGSASPAASDVSQAVDKVVEIPRAADDARIAEILNSLSRQAGWFPHVRLSVKDGMVLIEGKTKDAQQLEWLAKTADRLPTVVAVINKAEIETPPVTDLTPAWKEFQRIVERAKRGLPLVLLAFALLAAFGLLGRYLSRGVHALWGRHISNPFLLSTVAKLTMAPVWVLFFYLALQTAGLSALATTIIGGTGALGIVLGFAFKDIAENYLSGLLLAIRSPFTKGDEISVEGYEGYVRSLNMRGTSIIDYEGNIVLIPNSIVIKSVIRNRTANPSTRMSFSVGIGYNDSVSRAQELIYEVLKEIPAVLADPAPLVVAEELGSSTVNLKVMLWYDCVKSSSYRTKSVALSRVKETLLANGISLPDDRREVLFPEPLRVRQFQSVEEERSSAAEEGALAKERATSNLQRSREAVTAKGHERDVEKLGDRVEVLRPSADGQLLEI